MLLFEKKNEFKLNFITFENELYYGQINLQ